MGWNRYSLQYLPFGYGNEFPAFLTWISGVDIVIIDMMRSLFDKGVRPESFTEMLLELHSKEYTRLYLKRENLLQRDMRIRTKQLHAILQTSGLEPKKDAYLRSESPIPSFIVD